MSGKRLLIVDDDPEISNFVRAVAGQFGYEVAVAGGAEEFRGLYAAAPPDVIVLDIVMPGEDGIELLRFLAGEHCEAQIIIVSGYSRLYLRSSETLARDWGLPSVSALAKPIELAALEDALRSA